ncbi:MAG: hypothetical protein O3C67_04810 [Cyanobacteria bacterium]|nr:hypothetical protein [Cyanobacteriota bacterium]MEB3269773.1 hypothetical protein [Leptolyngbya sp.]
MPKLDTTPIETTEGWMVQVYDRDRRLICLIEPSHGWAFFFGCLLGFLVTAVGFSRANPSTPVSTTTPEAPVVAPLQVE